MAVFGTYSKQGVPVYQHDRTLTLERSHMRVLAVADGHGSAETGHLASDFTVHHVVPTLHSHNALLSPSPSCIARAIDDLDRRIIEHTSSHRSYAGTTLCMALHDTSTSTLHFVNVGDSRALLVRRDGGVRQVTTDHDVNDSTERERVEGAGGVFVGKLINGYISMTRGLGDDDLKAHRNITKFPVCATGNANANYGSDLYINTPDVRKVKLKRHHLALVLMSDGVTAKVSNKQVAKIVAEEVSKHENTDMNDVAKKIVKAAVRKGSKDNISAVVSLLNVNEEGEVLLEPSEEEGSLSVSPISTDDESGGNMKREQHRKKQQKQEDKEPRKHHHLRQRRAKAERQRDQQTTTQRLGNLKLPGWNRLKQKPSQ